jgi:hypothetical protein
MTDLIFNLTDDADDSATAPAGLAPAGSGVRPTLLALITAAGLRCVDRYGAAPSRLAEGTQDGAR